MAKSIKGKRTTGPVKAVKNKKLDLSIRAVIDNMVFSKSDRWAYYKVANSPFDFLDAGSKYQLGVQLNNAFTNIMSERQTPLDMHLIVASSPVDVDAWRRQNEDAVSDWASNPSFDRYLDMQEKYLREQEYMQKTVYLGVHLGRRGSQDIDAMNIVEGGVKAAVDTAREALSSFLSMPTDSIPKSEEEYTRNKENDFYQILSSGHLRATRCTSEDILLLIKRQLYPSMPAPYLDVDPKSRLGPGDLDLEFGHIIRNKFRWLEMTQIVGDQEMTGYRATLAFSKFPKESEFPNNFPFMYFLSRLGFPFTMYSRFTFHPVQAMQKEVAKQKKGLVDGLKNASVGGETVDTAIEGLPPELGEGLTDMNNIKSIITQDKSPWLSGSYYVIVETPTEKTLKKYCATLKQKFTDLDINLTWTAGDQAKLFLEQMPGDKQRVSSFTQVTNVSQIATSGMNFASEVGDDIKPMYSLDEDDD